MHMNKSLRSFKYVFGNHESLSKPGWEKSREGGTGEAAPVYLVPLLVSARGLWPSVSAGPEGPMSGDHAYICPFSMWEANACYHAGI